MGSWRVWEERREGNSDQNIVYKNNFILNLKRERESLPEGDKVERDGEGTDYLCTHMATHYFTIWKEYFKIINNFFLKSSNHFP